MILKRHAWNLPQPIRINTGAAERNRGKVEAFPFRRYIRSWDQSSGSQHGLSIRQALSVMSTWLADLYQ